LALFTTTEFKDHEGIVGSSLDTLIGQLATRATAYFEKSTNRKLELASGLTEDYSGDGTRDLILRYTPVATLTSITLSLDRNFAGATALAAGEYVLDKEAGIVKRVNATTIPVQTARAGAVWPVGDYNVRVVYDAGYATVPEDLKEAAILWAARRLARRGLMGVQSETIGSHSISLFAGGADREVEEILSRYRSYPKLGEVRNAT